MGCSKSNSVRKMYRGKCLHCEKGKISNKQPNFTLQGIRITNYLKGSRRKGIIKLKLEINEIQNRKTMGKISKINSWFV